MNQMTDPLMLFSPLLSVYGSTPLVNGDPNKLEQKKGVYACVCVCVVGEEGGEEGEGGGSDRGEGGRVIPCGVWFILSKCFQFHIAQSSSSEIQIPKFLLQFV